MNEIKQAFEGKKAFIAFLTAGDPDLAHTADYILTMQEAGADLIEIGIPFSDPVAEGEVIERANMRALAAGTTIEKIFAMLDSIKAQVRVPLVFLTYVNPLLFYGYEAFFQRAREVGISGAVIPDLPFEEQGELKEAAEAAGIALITLLAPTSEERTPRIAKSAKGFLYLVSSMGTTGVRSGVFSDIPAAVERIKKHTDTPVAVGFGIAEPEQARNISAAADGVIVGSAIVKLIERYGKEAAAPLAAYIKKMKEAVRENDPQ